MDVAELKTKIKSKQLPSYIIFSGDEWKVQEIYINQIAKITGKEIRRVDSVSSIYFQLRGKSFIQKSYIYIVRDDRDLMTSEKLQQQISNGLLNDNILIHLLTSVDKRTKFYKQYKDVIVDFEHLDESTLRKYIKKEINLSDKNCQILIDICEYNYGRILLEIDKIKSLVSSDAVLFGHGDKRSTEEDIAFQMLLNDGTIYVPPYDAIFDFVDKVLDRQVTAAFDLLQQSYDVGEATLVMLSVLYNSAKSVLQVQSYSGGDLSKATGLTGWQIKKAKPHVGKYGDEELIQILRLVQKLESGIKSGRIDEEFVMPYLLIHIM